MKTTEEGSEVSVGVGYSESVEGVCGWVSETR